MTRVTFATTRGNVILIKRIINLNQSSRHLLQIDYEKLFMTNVFHIILGHNLIPWILTFKMN